MSLCRRKHPSPQTGSSCLCQLIPVVGCRSTTGIRWHKHEDGKKIIPMLKWSQQGFCMTTRVFSLSDCTYPHIINQAKSHTKVVFNSSQSRDFQSRHEHVLSGDVCSICKKERKKWGRCWGENKSNQKLTLCRNLISVYCIKKAVMF